MFHFPERLNAGVNLLSPQRRCKSNL